MGQKYQKLFEKVIHVSFFRIQKGLVGKEYFHIDTNYVKEISLFEYKKQIPKKQSCNLKHTRIMSLAMTWATTPTSPSVFHDEEKLIPMMQLTFS